VLGSINLSRFYRDGEIDYARLKEVIAIGVHFLDNIIEVSQFPIAQIEQMTVMNRKIGLGVMGWADLLIELGLRYDAPAALALADEVMRFVSREAEHASIELAKRRGPFPRWHQERIYKDTDQPPRRNATVTTVAPTGTISLIANCSSGIEPVYSVAYRRLSFESAQMLFVHPLFEAYARKHGFYSDALMRRVAETGSLDGLAEVPEAARQLFVTTHEVTPECHVRMQAAFQKHIDAAVSKTINFPAEASLDEVQRAYLLAHALGCKGITVYRDGSREKQILSTRPVDRNEPLTLAMASQTELQRPENQLLAKNICPDCGSALQRNGGCLYCTCGYSVCVQT
jgi:ribonucleoside-diphosphate reductase alpha chain